MNITVVGTGYVGLVTGTCFAETGVRVTCIDVDTGKINMLREGRVPIYEPGLEDMLLRNVQKDRLKFSAELKDGLVACDAVFIAVGTPPDEDGSADLKYVLAVARDIGKYMNDYLVVITKSTVPIGTSNKVKDTIKQELDARDSDLEFDVASNPEFLKEGNAIDDFLKPDRIVVGVESERAEKILRRLYKPFVLNGHPVLAMNIASAELTKYAANSMLATRISFMNEIAGVCELVGADINMVREGIGSDPRIGNKFLYAGVGYGGSCFPKDVKALVNTSKELGCPLRILATVDAVNNRQKELLFGKIMRHFNNDIKNKNFAIWGLSFKPNTDDMREAPALTLIDLLLKAGALIQAYDPVAMEEAERRLGQKISFAKDTYEALIQADALVVVTEWTEFRILNYKIMERLMRQKIVFDGRNIYEPAEVRENGFSYYGIGRM